MNKKVTVLTATYNYGHFVEEAVETVLKQSFQDFEYIVIDDGSSDDTAERLKKYQTQVNYIFQNNQGQDAAFNRALSISQGEYIAFLDADDKWHPDFLQHSVSFLDKKQTAMVFCDFSSFDQRGVWRESALINLPFIQEAGAQKEFILENCLEQLIQRDFIFPSCVLIRRNVFDQLRFEPMFDCAGDYDFFIRVAHHYKVGLINRPLIYKRDHKNNLSVNVSHAMKNRIVAMRRLLAHPSLDSKLITLAKNRLSEAYYYWAYDEFKKKNFLSSTKYAGLSLKSLLSWRALKTWGFSVFLAALVGDRIHG